MRQRVIIVAIAALPLLFLAVGADAAMVRVGRIVVRADGGFAPTKLPRHTYAPIRFQGWADVTSTDGAPPPALQSARIDFDHDGRLTTGGLPKCARAKLEGATVKQGRNRCGDALIGSGEIAALVSLPGSGPVTVRSPLSLFNGPRLGGNATVIAHAQATFPNFEVYVVTIPIERRRGTFGYRATLTIPEIANGAGVLTHVDARIGRRYRFKGARRSYVSGRCGDGIFETRGRFTFVDGTIIEGSVYKPCTVRR